MRDIGTLIRNDLKKASIIQIGLTLVLVVVLNAVQISKTLAPLTAAAVLYSAGGISEEDIERSRLGELCNTLEAWPMNIFVTNQQRIQDRCVIIHKRHMLRTSQDWIAYHDKVKALREKAKAEILIKMQEAPPPPPPWGPGVLPRPGVVPGTLPSTSTADPDE